MTHAYFKLDPIGFIEKLCENKDKPSLKCNGKCQLKKVSESTNNAQKIPGGVIDFKELLFITTAIEDYNVINLVNNIKDNFDYINFYEYLKISLLDYPPQV